MSIILDFIFPRTCYGCHRHGRYLCSDCLSLLSSKGVRPEYPHGFSGTLSLFKYQPPLKSLISGLKFDFVTDAVPEIAYLAVKEIKSNYPHLLDYWQQEHFTVVPVPLHNSRRLWRGFNQSSLLASVLFPLLELPVAAGLVSRFHSAPPQTSLKNKSHRRQNLSGVFSLNNQLPLPPKIIFFDDVFTTGSTLAEIRSLFPQGKNFEYWGLTLAG